MNIITLLLYAVILSIDATTVSITNGMCHVGVEKKRLFFSSVLFGVFQGAMPLIGYWIYYFLQEEATWVASTGTYVAFILLSLLGLKMIIDGIKAIKEKEILDCPVSLTNLSYKKIWIQAVATSIDALAVGLSICVANFDGISQDTNIFIAASVIALVTFIMSFIGSFAGLKMGVFMKRYAPLIGGLVLVLLGARILTGL